MRARRVPVGGGEKRAPASPIVRRLRAKIATLTPEAQRKLLAIAELLPESKAERK